MTLYVERSMLCLVWLTLTHGPTYIAMLFILVVFRTINMFYYDVNSKSKISQL